MYNNFEELNAAYPELSSKEGLSFEERVQYVQDCFDLYEKLGFLDRFRSRYSDSEEYDGQLFEVVRRISYTEDVDLEILPLWEIRFRNGTFTYAFPEEICKAENNSVSEQDDDDIDEPDDEDFIAFMKKIHQDFVMPEPRKSSDQKQKKYDVFFVLRGYAQIEAESEEEALQKASAIGYNDISWNDMYETEDAQPAEDN